jgi:O-antigen/teichoic acid export membrane protein
VNNKNDVKGQLAIETRKDIRLIAGGAGMSFIGILSANLLVYIYGIIIARALGADIWGLYSLGFVAMNIMSNFGRLGLGDGVLRFVALHKGSGDLSRAKGIIIRAIQISGIVSLLLAIILWCCAEWIADLFFNELRGIIFLKYFAVGVPLYSIFMILLLIMLSLKKVLPVIVARDCVQPALALIFLILVLMIWRTPEGLLLTYIISVLVALILIFYYLKVSFPPLLNPLKPIYETRKLLKFSLPAFVGDVSSYIFRSLDILMLSYFMAAVDVGIFSSAARTASILLFISAAFNTVYAPVISHNYHQGNQDQLQRLLKMMMRWCAIMGIPIAISMVVLAKPILALWGPQFVNGSKCIIYLALAQILNMLSGIITYTLLMCGRPWIVAINTMVAMAAAVVLNILLIPKYGINGAALAFCIVMGIMFVIRIIQLRIILGLNPVDFRILKPIAAGLVTMWLAIFIPNLFGLTIDEQIFNLTEVALKVIIVGLTYPGLLWLFGIEDEEIQVLNDFKLCLLKKF